MGFSDEKNGTVYLVGGGPGDPGLITLKAVAALRKADTVIYDRLVNPELLKYPPLKAELIYAGKSSSKHTFSQEKINQLIIKKAQEGKSVVRLKGGDPFLFGRGAEEALALVQEKIAFEVIPGVSSAIAAGAYAGIPLTHRQYTSSVGIFTGHENPDKEGSKIDWEKISCGLGTLVFLMGMENLSAIVKNLIKFGRRASTACCLIQEGTLPGQKSLSGKLNTIVRAARHFKFRPPCILIVGEVVSLRKKLNWLESKPLFGKKILVSRPQEEDNRLTQLLAGYGASCIELPVITIKPLEDYSHLETAIKQLDSFDWLIFSSQNGVKFFQQKLEDLKPAGNALKKLKFAAIGDKTALALENMGVKPNLIPKKFCQEGLLEGFKKFKIKGQRLLIINAREAREVLAQGLEKMGATVVTAPAYQTVSGFRSPVSGQTLKNVDVVTFTSSLAAKSFFSAFPKRILKNILEKTVIASIGPITSKTLKSLGYKAGIEAREYTLEGLTKAIVKHYKITNNQCPITK